MKVCGKLHNIERCERCEQGFTTFIYTQKNCCKKVFVAFALFAQVLSRYLSIVCIYKRTVTVATKTMLVKVKHD